MEGRVGPQEIQNMNQNTIIMILMMTTALPRGQVIEGLITVSTIAQNMVEVIPIPTQE